MEGELKDNENEPVPIVKTVDISISGMIFIIIVDFIHTLITLT